MCEAMFAVIRTNSKQYKVSPGQKIALDSHVGDPGKSHTFDDVLLVGEKDNATIGTPTVEGATVEAKVLEHTRDDKKITLKYKPKKRSRVKMGHRQDMTILEIVDIKK